LEQTITNKNKLDSVKAKSKKQALEFGEKYYFTGKPCLHGSISFRKSNGQCQCNDCVLRLKSLMKQWHKENKEANTATRLIWREKNKDRELQKHREWVEKNKDRVRSNMIAWRSSNKDKVTANHHKRRASKNNATVKWFSEFDEFVMQEAVDLAKLRLKSTNIEWQVDHMIPLRSKNACGLHCKENLQVIPKSLNLWKRNKMILTEPNEWIKYL
jgi:hypothetical protein